MTLVSTAANAAQSGGGSVALLSTTTLGSSGTFDIQNISQSYSDLIIVCMVRGTAAAASDNPFLRFNNDSGANYDTQQQAGSAGSSTAGESFGQTGSTAGQIPAATAPAGLFAHLEIIIPGYTSTTWNKVATIIHSHKAGTTTTTLQVIQWEACWRSTAAINRFFLSGFSTANLATASQVRIYGRA